MENELEKRAELEKRILLDLFEKAVVMKSEYVKDYEIKRCCKIYKGEL